MISAVLLIITIILSKNKKVKPFLSKKILKIVIGIEIVGLVMSVGELVTSKVLFDNSIERPEVDEGDTTEELEYKAYDKTTDITVDVPAVLHSKEEKENLLKKAKEEIDETFKGDNDDLDSINRAVVMKEKYSDGMVKAKWELSDYKIVGSEGEINYDSLEKDTIVEANVVLTCEDLSDVYSFSFQVKPLDASSSYGLDYHIKRTIRDLFDTDDRTIELPDKVGDVEVSWSKKYTYLGEKIGILGVFATVLMIVGQMREEKTKKEKYIQSLTSDYPKIVESLALYVGAGLSVKNAMYRICEEYIRRRANSKGAGFEGILRMCKEMEEGRSELKAYEELATYCPAKEYRRLSSMLINNLKKGTKGMIEELNKEEKEAFEMQKQYVRIAGEEASTKLLFPMIGLLGIVLVIIIAPSILNMQSI